MLKLLGSACILAGGFLVQGARLSERRRQWDTLSDVLTALRRMGAEVEQRGGSLLCRGGGQLRGCGIDLALPSVGATENAMLAACGARGRTVLYNAAREPEIWDLQQFLNACGARIQGAGSSVITRPTA